MIGLALTRPDLDLFALLVHELTVAEDAGAARARAASPLVDLIGADALASFTHDPRVGTYTEPVTVGQDPQNVARYLQEFQHGDPLAPTMRRLGRATRTDDVLPRAALRRTDFYRDFLARDGLDHGLNLFVVDHGTHLGDVRLWRARGSSPFGARETALLDALAPYLRAALRRERVGSTTVGPPLTPREQQVAELVATGLTDRAVATRLGISFATVRTHLSRALGKTGAPNRAALAALVAARGGGHRP